MTQLTSQGWGYSFYNGWDENDSTWIEKRLDDWFGRRVRSVKRDRADIEDLTILTQIANLQEVFITNSRIKDLSPLSEIATIKVIEFIGSDVDDLTPLRDLSNLAHLNVYRTTAIDDQVESLAKKLPNCNILHPSTESR